MLPKSIRTKVININDKTIEISPWTNLTLTKFEGIYESSEEDNFTLIKNYLIEPFIVTKSKLTLLEYRYLLIELFKLSNGNKIDIEYTCKKCDNRSSYTIDLEESVKYKKLENRVIKTDSYIFNLKKNSLYYINYNSGDVELEILKYLASYISSIESENETYEVVDLEEITDWLNTELKSNEFNHLIKEFTKIQPDLDVKDYGICEHCGESSELNFKGIENFILKY